MSVAAMLDTVIVVVVRERGTRPAVTLSIGTTAFVETEFTAALSARTHSVGALFVVGTFVSIGLIFAQLRSTRPRVPLSRPIATLFLTLVVLVMGEMRTRSAVALPVSSATLRVSALSVTRVSRTELSSSTMRIGGTLSADITITDAGRALVVRIAILATRTSTS